MLDAGDTDITQYVWDNRNRLVEVVDRALFGGDPTQIVDYLYDVENRWIAETIDSDGDGDVDRLIGFAYDGNQVVLQFEKDLSSPLPPGEGQGEGCALTGADLSHRYLWQANAVDQLLADEQLSPLPPGEGQGEAFDLSQPGNVVLPLADHLGTIRDLAESDDGLTVIANHRFYDSYGNLKSETNSAVDCLFGYTGRAFDGNTGLQNNLNRWYDAKAGDWISEDPIGFFGRDVNLSRYCGNDPINKTDPNGKFAVVVGAGVVFVWWLFISGPNEANAPGPNDVPRPAPDPIAGLPSAVAAGLATQSALARRRKTRRLVVRSSRIALLGELGPIRR